MQRPRDLDKIVPAVLREAEFAGDAFYWSWPVKNKKTGKVEMLEGPSIGLAMAVAREWTNCAVPVEYYETLTEWIFTAHFVDLEKGVDLELILQQWHVSRLEELDQDRAQEVLEWLEGQ